MKKIHKQTFFSRGQALTEVLVSLVFFVPVFLLVPIIGKYLDIKQKTIEASRYAVWERSIWSDPGSSWDNNENSKNDEAIALEVDRRFFGHLSQLITDKSAFAHNSVVENPMWTTIDTTVDVHSKKKQSNNTETKSLTLPILKGVNTGSKTLRAYTEIKEEKIPVSSIGVDQIARLMGVKVNDYVIATVSTPIKNYTVSDEDLFIQAKSALLTNTWSAADEAKFKERVDELVWDEPVNALVKTGNAIAVGGVIALGLYTDGFGLSADASVDSTILPEHLLRKEAAPDQDEVEEDSNTTAGNSDYDANSVTEAMNTLDSIDSDKITTGLPSELNTENLEQASDDIKAQAETETQTQNAPTQADLDEARANLTDDQRQELNEHEETFLGQVDSTVPDLTDEQKQGASEFFQPETETTQENP